MSAMALNELVWYAYVGEQKMQRVEGGPKWATPANINHPVQRFRVITAVLSFNQQPTTSSQFSIPPSLLLYFFVVVSAHSV